MNRDWHFCVPLNRKLHFINTSSGKEKKHKENSLKPQNRNVHLIGENKKPKTNTNSGSTRRLCYRGKNIEGTSTDGTGTTDNDSTTRALEIIPVSLQNSILQSTDSSLERHPRER